MSPSERTTTVRALTGTPPVLALYLFAMRIPIRGIIGGGKIANIVLHTASYGSPSPIHLPYTTQGYTNLPFPCFTRRPPPIPSLSDVSSPPILPMPHPSLPARVIAGPHRDDEFARVAIQMEVVTTPLPSPPRNWSASTTVLPSLRQVRRAFVHLSRAGLTKLSDFATVMKSHNVTEDQGAEEMWRSMEVVKQLAGGKVPYRELSVIYSCPLLTGSRRYFLQDLDPTSDEGPIEAPRNSSPPPQVCILLGCILRPRPRRIDRDGQETRCLRTTAHVAFRDPA